MAETEQIRVETPQDAHELRSVAQLRFLHTLAPRLNSLDNVVAIGEAITTELQTLIDYHNCRVYLLQDDGVTLFPIVFRGSLGEYESETYEELVTPVGEGITGHVAETGTTHYAPDALNDPVGIQIAGTSEIDESILAVPMKTGERVNGVIVLSNLGIDQFNEEDIRVLEVLASHAAVAFDNARLLQQEREAKQKYSEAFLREREAAQRLRALDTLKNTFLEAVSHDLRTPLTSILGSALTLEHAGLHIPREDALDLLHRIAANARKLERLLSDLLDLDRLQRGIVSPQRRRTDVGGLVAQAVHESELLEGRDLNLDLDEVVADIDAAKVERIVENLLANAARHTPRDATLWVRVTREDGGALIVVEDAGPGVPDEMKRTVFEPFRQGNGGPNPSPGVGVGLSLVARFAELHGGSAWVQDRPGGGASFRVFLPDAA